MHCDAYLTEHWDVNVHFDVALFCSCGVVERPLDVPIVFVDHRCGASTRHRVRSSGYDFTLSVSMHVDGCGIETVGIGILACWTNG